MPDQHNIAVWFGDPPDGVDWFRAFEAYGHAMTAASALEQLMALIVVKAEVFRLGRRAMAQTNAAEQKLLMANVMRGNFVKIQGRIRKAFKLSDLLQESLNIAKDGRDNLAHNFWQAHIHNLWSERGIDVIAGACALYANHFRNVANLLIEETGVDAQDYIDAIRAQPKEEAYFAGWEKLMRNELKGQ
jgi:hypothetical protein